jgi:methionyl-tRNA formyltransferase
MPDASPPLDRERRLLVLTSRQAAVDDVTAIARASFAHVTVLFWQFGNRDTRPAVVEALEATDYDLLVSHVNGLVLRPHQLARATHGAVNIHPAPPEHPGAMGIYCQPVIRRDVRTHHGVTVHEMDERIDHGPIYRADRWDVAPDATIASVADRAVAHCLTVFAELVPRLAASREGSASLPRADERWDVANGHHTVEDLRAWFAALDPAHPAHGERVPMNHPRALLRPPYFDDL